MAERQKRQIAYKARIKDLLDGRYVKEEGWTPNYIEAGGRKISRVNLIGTVVSKENVESFQSLMLDDGTGTIAARSFEKNPVLDEVDIGDIVLIIGRPREYGTERYVLIEIIKKIENKKWILYRKAELEEEIGQNIEEPVKEGAMPTEEKPNAVEEISVSSESVSESSPAEIVLKRIKEFDKGEGADFDEVTKGIDDSEKVISSLLGEGEIFEIKPGKLKVLE